MLETEILKTSRFLKSHFVSSVNEVILSSIWVCVYIYIFHIINWLGMPQVYKEKPDPIFLFLV